MRLSAASYGSGLPAEGQLMSIAQNTALFSLLGTQYGGNGQTTFRLPDLRNAAPKSATGGVVRYYICTEGIYPSRD
ncbi:phage tail protein [Deinococcus maricopensis]|uniref:phage tail protein n=1 Tax=Deinococcus maricopensis TaxID=309887 RepID=UPI0002D8D3E0|nr:tail fiber protein [Deinococcus maricopensis]